MNGIYGNMLLAWTEQQRQLEAYAMTPKVNGGWNIVEGSEIPLIGVFQNTRGSAVKDSNGNLVKTDGRELWTKTENLDGMFINWEGTVYRINSSNNWGFEGGFFRYGLEKVVGNDATESDNATWNTGANSFC